MSLCNGCIHKTVCRKTVRDGDLGYGYFECPHFLNTADVVPREEVARIKQETAREIFEEIEKIMERYLDSPLCNYHKIRIAFTELKKEYTEDSTDGKRTDR